MALTAVRTTGFRPRFDPSSSAALVSAEFDWRVLCVFDDSRSRRVMACPGVGS